MCRECRAAGDSLLDTRHSADRAVQQVRDGRVRRTGRTSDAETQRAQPTVVRLRRLPVRRTQPARHNAPDRHTLRSAIAGTLLPAIISSLEN